MADKVASLSEKDLPASPMLILSICFIGYWVMHNQLKLKILFQGRYE